MIIMRLLILGGTRFVGRALTDAAHAAGHTVTLFNRGNTNPDLFPNVERLRGDRDGDLSALEGRTWDAAIDVSGYIPRHVALSARTLADAVAHYTFISTISVYDTDAINATNGTDEDGPLTTLEDETVEEITGETYGGLKVLCERAAEDAMPDRVLTVRPGLIVGPHDHTDRFTYWPVRVARGGTMLAPPAKGRVQVIDVRDMAAWIIRRVEAGDTATYNAVGEMLTFSEVIDACKDAAGKSAASVVIADEEMLLAQEVQPWTDLPLWLPDAMDGILRISKERARSAGLTSRPIAETIQDTLAWFQAERDDDLTTGMSAEKEARVLAAIT
jgi:2'-hydroxyisoflavone reductase